ncbi:PHP domain-containing protein [Desulfococcaceae bacterium OttesenSCG-928-F15]|nr:PHP domain-containing protein [Desulfococcaceae bacterium OttesenSCG-928-F15]
MASERNERPVDLHIHTTASDGSLSPLDLPCEVRRSGLAAFSITDHDTIAGVQELLDAGLPSDLSFITGLEISATPPENIRISEELHILGYGIDVKDKKLNLLMEELRTARMERNPKMVARLQSMGLDISLEEVAEKAGGKVVGRPHMAQVLVDKKIVPDSQTAFQRYLGKGCPAYVDKYRVPWKEAIQTIDEAGGLAVLAHPGMIPQMQDHHALERLLLTLKEGGLRGVEVYYTQHKAGFVKNLEKIAEKLGLLMTGGSDFHGTFKEDIRLGTGHGNLFVPFFLYEKLLEALKKG